MSIIAIGQIAGAGQAPSQRAETTNNTQDEAKTASADEASTASSSASNPQPVKTEAAPTQTVRAVETGNDVKTAEPRATQAEQPEKAEAKAQFAAEQASTERAFQALVESVALSVASDDLGDTEAPKGDDSGSRQATETQSRDLANQTSTERFESGLSAIRGTT